MVLRSSVLLPALASLVLAASGGAALAKPKPKVVPGRDKCQAAVDAMIECAKKKDVDCAGARAADVKNYPAFACDMLLGELETREEEVHQLVARTLVDLKCADAIPAVIDLLGLPDWEQRGQTALLFAPMKDKRLIEPIGKMMDTASPYDRELCCQALATMGFAEGIPLLLKAARHSMFSVRLKAAESLGEFRGKEVTQALCDMVSNDSNPGVKVKAAEALGKVKDVEAVPCLAKGLDDRAGLVITASHAGLQAITGMDLGLASSAWMQWWEKEQQNKKR
jgi:HEAT repeat protein